MRPAFAAIALTIAIASCATPARFIAPPAEPPANLACAPALELIDSDDDLARVDPALLADLCVSACWAMCHDIGGPRAGTVAGAMNTVGNIGGAISPLVVGYTVLITIWLPEFWLHQYCPVLKNVPFVCAIWLVATLENRRWTT